MLPFELTKDTPYLALSGELWSVFCEYFNRNWPCYKGFLLYMEPHFSPSPCVVVIVTCPLTCWELNKMAKHFADDIFTKISLNDDYCILIAISLKFVSCGSTDGISALAQGTNGLMPNTTSHYLNRCWQKYLMLFGFTTTYHTDKLRTRSSDFLVRPRFLSFQIFYQWSVMLVQKYFGKWNLYL